MIKDSPPLPDPELDLGAAPPWLRSSPGEEPESLAFRAGAALAALHPLVAQPRADVPAALLRDRLALGAALACLNLVGRIVAPGDLRDAVHRSGSACLNTVRGVSKWIGCGFQAAAGVGVATLMYA